METVGKAGFSQAVMKTVIVLGMHRSGSSLVAGILHHLGVNMGRRLLGPKFDNPKGFYENLNFLYLNERLLHSAGGTWYNPPSAERIKELDKAYSTIIKTLVDQEKSELWGWKDPRTVITLPLYMSYVKQPCFVVVHRNPLAIAMSLHRRDGFSVEEGLTLFSVYTNRLAKWLLRWPKIDRLHLQYEQCIAEPQAMIDRIKEFIGISTNRNPIHLVDKRLNHSGTSDI